MDRNDLLTEIAGLSAEAFASFQRKVLVRRTELFSKRLEALSTHDLRARGLELLEHARNAIDEQRKITTRQLEHLEWMEKRGDDEPDDADVAFTQDLGHDSDRAANLVAANSAEMTAILTILGHRGANLKDEKGGA
jgi:hypothetical protein